MKMKLKKHPALLQPDLEAVAFNLVEMMADIWGMFHFCCAAGLSPTKG